MSQRNGKGSVKKVCFLWVHLLIQFSIQPSIRIAVQEDPTNRPVLAEAFKRLHRLWKQHNEQLQSQSQLQPFSNSSLKHAEGPVATKTPSVDSFLDVDERDEERSWPIEHRLRNNESENQPNISSMTVPQAINEHKRKVPNRIPDIWQTFDEYGKLGDITAKYWKGYYLFYNLMNFPEAE